jgi:hypothetical protein
MDSTTFAFVGSTKSGRAAVAERAFTSSVNVRHHFLLYHKVTAGCPHSLAKKSLKLPVALQIMVNME